MSTVDGRGIIRFVVVREDNEKQKDCLKTLSNIHELPKLGNLNLDQITLHLQELLRMLLARISLGDMHTVQIFLPLEYSVDLATTVRSEFEFWGPDSEASIRYTKQADIWLRSPDPRTIASDLLNLAIIADSMDKDLGSVVHQYHLSGIFQVLTRDIPPLHKPMGLNKSSTQQEELDNSISANASSSLTLDKQFHSPHIPEECTERSVQSQASSKDFGASSTRGDGDATSSSNSGNSQGIMDEKEADVMAEPQASCGSHGCQLHITSDDEARHLSTLELWLSAMQWIRVKNSVRQGQVDLDMWKGVTGNKIENRAFAHASRNLETIMLKAQTTHRFKGIPISRPRLLASYGCGELDINGRKATWEDLDNADRCTGCSKGGKDCFRVNRDVFYTDAQCPQCLREGMICSFTDD